MSLRIMRLEMIEQRAVPRRVGFFPAVEVALYRIVRVFIRPCYVCHGVGRRNVGAADHPHAIADTVFIVAQGIDFFWLFRTDAAALTPRSDVIPDPGLIFGHRPDQ
jgi:hypothetical protein